MATTYKITVNDPRYQESLSYLQGVLVSDFIDIYGKPTFNIDYCFDSSSKETTQCDIFVNDPRHWEFLVCQQADVAAKFVEMYGVPPPTINYTFRPG